MEKRNLAAQFKLRKELLITYQHCCVLTGYHPENVLDAAHIIPHNQCKNNPKLAFSITNALLIRTDLHRLFDQDYWTIKPTSSSFKIVWLKAIPHDLKKNLTNLNLSAYFQQLTDASYDINQLRRNLISRNPTSK